MTTEPESAAGRVADVLRAHAERNDAAITVALAEMREAVQQLRQVHHTLRHPYIAGCAECIYLKWFEERGW